MADVVTTLTGGATDLSRYISLDGTTGTPVVRAPGDNRAGVYDWLVGSGLPGYLFHLRTTADSVDSESIIALGVDKGLGGGLLISQKGAGVGLQIEQAPGSAAAQVITAGSSSAWLAVNQFIGSGGSYLRLRDRQFKVDGVTTAGSSNFSSATIGFTAADVGATIELMPSVQLAFGGTTRTITAFIDSQNVTLSAPASISSTGIKFTVSGRTIPANQIVDRVFDADGSSLLYGRFKGYAVNANPFQARDVTTAALVVQAISNQTSDLLRALGSDGVLEHFAIRAGGNAVAASGLDISNANRSSSSATVLNVTSSNTTSRALVVKGNNTTDTVQVQNATGTSTFRIDKAGRLALKVATVPADTDVSNGEAVFYVDSTVAAPKVTVKMKDSAGTVVTQALGAGTASADTTDYLSVYNAAKAV